MYRVQVRCDRGMARSRPGAREAARAALQHQEAPDGDLTVVLSGAAKMQELNRRYAGDDYPTDVLSFVDGSREPETGRKYFGDVVIAVPVAEEQARAAGHSLATEVALLVVHGVLHLLGHDHGRTKERALMEAAESEILKILGIPSLSPRAP
ncbi:MAG: rRNA maturation RNase YbeY [Chloroflexi bacterium RBG_13_66_10]|nr:MAG: rRNA maturation RNase YbeY [Chloroflexi bacterium RBG_13_66_10]